ncbi:MAG: hypothetical protein AB7U40_03680 [Methanobacteriales archaeon]
MRGNGKVFWKTCGIFFEKKDKVNLAYLFGSTQGDKGKLGDFDLGVLLDEPLGKYERSQFQLKLFI